MKHFLILMAAAAWAVAADLPASMCDVVAHGAKGDGVTVDTVAIQKAVDACAARGGGTVWFPAGNFVSGTITLKSNITLHLTPGATLTASRNIKDYSPLHLIYANGVDNISVEGRGTIFGDGDYYWDKSARITSGYAATSGRAFAVAKQRPSPLLEFVNCRRVNIQDVFIRNAPGWTIHPLQCDGVKIHGISIVNHPEGPNTDGIDPDSSCNVQIADSYIEAGDDCIVLKTTGKLGGKTLPTENVTVTNCILATTCYGFKIGTESLGDFKNISVSNCSMYQPANTSWPLGCGLAVETVDGATIDGVVISNITMRNARAPIFIRLGNRGRGMKTPVPGVLRNVSISNVVASNCVGPFPSSIAGLPGHPVQGVSLQDINITMKGGEKEARGLDVTENPDGYPGVAMFGPLPAYGLYVRHVEGLTMRNVQIRWEEQDAQPSAVFDDVQDLELDGFRADTMSTRPALWFNNVTGALVERARAMLGVEATLRITGKQSKTIRLSVSDLTPDVAAGVPEPLLR